MTTEDRWSLLEYGIPVDLVNPIAKRMDITRAQVRELLVQCGDKARRILRLSENPLSFSGDAVRATDIAGLLRVAPGIELEIAPKFLGLDFVNSRWREDFFLISTLSRHGRLLASERLHARAGDRDDLDTLVARSMADMYWQNSRRPLRSYRMHRFEDPSLDGDVEPEVIVQPEPDGYLQSSLIYDKYNRYNATILGAARQLLSKVREPYLLGQVGRVCQALAPQRPLIGIPHKLRLPNRAQRWQPLYDLSVDALRGFGLSFGRGTARSPGYIMDTWRVWEDLLGTTIRWQLGPNRVRIQKSSMLGIRRPTGADRTVRGSLATVTPDIAVFDAASGSPRFLVDAKYKARDERGKIRVSEADLYEAFAFSQAAKCGCVVLAYPSVPRLSSQLGQVVAFEEISIDKAKIIGVEVETRGISSRGGWARFSKRLVTDLEDIVTSCV